MSKQKRMRAYGNARRAREAKERTMAICGCENSVCRMAHSEPEKMCPERGVVPVEYVGQICFGCAEFMPTMYLLPSSYRVDRMKAEARSR